MPEYLPPIVYEKAEMRLGRVEGMENLVRRLEQYLACGESPASDVIHMKAMAADIWLNFLCATLLP
jgi:hypothetical protein